MTPNTTVLNFSNRKAAQRKPKPDPKIIFHDLGNMLTALSLSVSRIETGLVRDTARLQEYSKRSAEARVQMEHAASLLRDHINQAALTTFSPHETIERCIEVFSEKARQSGINIFNNSNKLVRIVGSKNNFCHIVNNLISNAIEAFDLPPQTKHAESVLNNRVQKQNTHRQKVVRVELDTMLGFVNLIVTDTGYGIKPTHISKIFNESFTTKPKGCGIGLYAVKQFVEKEFRGTISVESSSRGTKFIVRIPNVQLKRSECT